MAKKDKNYYEILGLAPHSTNSEIKRAYRQLVKVRHPDLGHRNKSSEERQSDAEQMLLLNQAYETLMDKSRRAQYDVLIGVTIRIVPKFKFEKLNEDEDRERFLGQVFHPSRTNILKLVKRYKKQIQQLSQDPYDDDLIAEFSDYLDELEAALRQASDSFSRHKTPKTLAAAVLMMRHCIAQAADALDELRNYCLNYDYNHLTLAESLFKIAYDNAKEALALTKH